VEVAKRLERSAQAFHPEPTGWRAQTLGFEARLDSLGAELIRNGGDTDETIHVAITGWGRTHQITPLEPAAARTGQCTPAIAVDGTCIPRVERIHPGLDEWWVALGSGVEFGLDLLTRPEGTAPITVELVIEGATVETDGETAWLTDGSGGLWTLGSMLAWDADGEPLGTLIEHGEAGHLRLVVDDTDARWPITIDPIIQTAATTLSDGSTSNGHGYSMDGAGDLDGDGYDDVVVGAPFGSNAVYVYYGSPTGLANTPDDTISSPLSGSDDDDWGWDVAGVGDVDGDGFDDVVVGARTWNANAGRAVVLPGSGIGLLTSGTELGGGSSGSGQFGSSVAGAGDVNGDGFMDVVVGEPSANSGSVYVFHGALAAMDSTIQTTIVAVSSSGNLGSAVAGAGDVNGDGFDDIVIGDDSASTFAGEVHIHHGSPGGVSTTADTTITNKHVCIG